MPEVSRCQHEAFLWQFYCTAVLILYCANKLLFLNVPMTQSEQNHSVGSAGSVWAAHRPDRWRSQSGRSANAAVSF